MPPVLHSTIQPGRQHHGPRTTAELPSRRRPAPTPEPPRRPRHYLGVRGGIGRPPRRCDVQDPTLAGTLQCNAVELLCFLEELEGIARQRPSSNVLRHIARVSPVGGAQRWALRVRLRPQRQQSSPPGKRGSELGNPQDHPRKRQPRPRPRRRSEQGKPAAKSC
jgi:hypothetical protein